MKNETMLIIGGIGVISASYIGYLYNKVNKISKMLDVAVDNISSGISSILVYKELDSEALL